MIRKVTKAWTTWSDPAAKFDAWNTEIAQAIWLSDAFRCILSLGMESANSHEREIVVLVR